MSVKPKHKKKCPRCGLFSGPRTLKCECGHEFIGAKSTPKPVADTEKEAMRFALACGSIDKAMLALAELKASLTK